MGTEGSKRRMGGCVGSRYLKWQAHSMISYSINQAQMVAS